MDKKFAAHNLCAGYLVRPAESVNGLGHLNGHVAICDLRAAAKAAVPAGLRAFAGYSDGRLEASVTIASVFARAGLTITIPLPTAVRIHTKMTA